MMKLVKSCSRSLPDYIFIEVMLKTYPDKLYVYKLYDAKLQLPDKFLWKLCSKLSFSKEVKKLCIKFICVVLKYYPIKSWLEKFMRKSYKYHKNYAANLSVIHTYVLSDLLKVENCGGRNFP